MKKIRELQQQFLEKNNIIINIYNLYNIYSFVYSVSNLNKTITTQKKQHTKNKGLKKNFMLTILLIC